MTAYVLSAKADGYIGSTCFFRNRKQIDTMLQLIDDTEKSSMKVLFHACSIGAEPYSWAIKHRTSEYSFDLDIFATDACQQFLSVAIQGKYPIGVTDDMWMTEAFCFDSGDWFDPTNKETELKHRYKAAVMFLPPMDFREELMFDTFDVVVLNNTLVYCSEAEQAKAIDAVAKYNKEFFICSGFHADTIEADLTRNGYVPVTTNMEAIYNNWAIGGTVKEPFNPKETFKHCTIFRKA
jgi:chemotaxis methyl-accepting protein methylase